MRERIIHRNTLERGALVALLAGIVVAIATEQKPSAPEVRLVSTEIEMPEIDPWLSPELQVERGKLRQLATEACNSLSPERHNQAIAAATEFSGLQEFLEYRRDLVVNPMLGDIGRLNDTRRAILMECLAERNHPQDAETLERISLVGMD